MGLVTALSDACHGKHTFLRQSPICGMLVNLQNMHLVTSLLYVCFIMYLLVMMPL